MLIVDDTESVRVGLARTLRKELSVATAPSAMNALKVLAAEPFDIVLSDFQMPPGQDGVWFLYEVARLYPASRRFLMTGSTSRSFVAHVSAGVIEHVFIKPVSARAFLERLAR